MVGSRIQNIRVQAPARLHLGFLDLHGGLGRRFGSLGLAVEGMSTRLTVGLAETARVEGVGEVERAARMLDVLSGALDLPPMAVTIEETIPAHAGLGSGTQLGLALGVAAARLAGVERSARDVARLLERGARSGIGIGAFDQGGFILDGGRAQDGEPPPVTARLAFPENWRILLVLDHGREGLHGIGERSAFGALPPYAPELAAELCRRVVMQLLPGLAVADLVAVGEAIGAIQRRVGDYFAPQQGGRFTSPAVAEVLAWIEARGFAGIGQSSWGPTGFAILPDVDTAEALRRDALRGVARRAGLDLRVVAGRNVGAEVVPIA